MLQLQAAAIDMCRISKLLVRYNIKASITNQAITLEGDISEEMLTKLCSSIDIDSVQNFVSESTQYNVYEEMPFSKSEETIQNENKKESEQVEEPIQSETVEEPEVSEETIQSKTVEEPEEIEEVIQSETVEESEKVTESIQAEEVEESTEDIEEHQLIYPVVKRGQVYWCDVDFDSGVEEEKDHKIRPVIIVSNDIVNMEPQSKYVKVIPCSTTSTWLPWNYHFRFTDEIMIEKVEEAIDNRFSNAYAILSKPVNKNRLVKYIGTMTPKFMDKMQDIIDEAYALKRNVKTVVKKETVYVNRPVLQKAPVNHQSQKQIEESNAIRKQLLEFVDSTELQKVLQSDWPNHTKVQKIIELYGFDINQNGVTYLLKAINLSIGQSYFNLETLSEQVSKKVGIAKEEVMRLIVARVKERFGYKKAPTIDFIRLVNSLLLRQEEEK